MDTGTCFLADRGVLKIVGDATALLHKVITNTMLNFVPGEARYSALLTPQGKLLFDFFILPLPEGPEAGYLIDCAKEQSADLLKRINFHKMRAKFTVEDVSEQFGVAAFWGSDPAPAIEGAVIYLDPRAPEMGKRLIASRAALAALPADTTAYEAHRVSLGVPKGGVDFPYGDTFLHDANIDRCNGVDFKKGCYVGQEVVARVHFRRSARKRIIPLHFEGPTPALGTEIKAGETSIGQVSSTAGAAGLAMLRLDRLEDARTAGTPVKAGEAVVEAFVPAEFVESAAGVEKRL
ncbi:YgfZ/GcvT domain-containing protein [Beijerinckia indica]|uniref:Folate-binding protein YgfZ n=1 Tax=Beijerinckia indica subsp. indica (strain ATCC 9039 / DSM 1715 / NCIMB 8712) TaxID=395963 RepID=B2IGI0_BEII9|nr:folate-binding protein YgfZ [Beijerinckia indica]ACB94362.1 folate-binding protein YgfZ [Beijerinckia indica subsp. indica ATCC 9039]